MEFKGTKGKWFVDYSEQYMNGSNVLCTPISTNQVINLCDIYGDDDTAKANTLLISKAPEMLELLQSLVSSEMTPLAIRKQAKQLIKEATEI